MNAKLETALARLRNRVDVKTMGASAIQEASQVCVMKLTLLCVKWIAIRNLLYGTGNWEKGLCVSLEEWDGKGGGREFQEGGDMCIPMADSC